MNLKCILLLSAVVASSAIPHHKGKITSRPNEDNIDWYDCSHKDNGDYPNPRDCTRFIKCSETRAADMACPDCNQPDEKCAGNPYLVWDNADGVKRCEWPLHTPCVEDPVTEEPVDPTTTEPEPTPEPTEAPGPGDGVCGGVRAGDACDEDDCEHCGYCKDKVSFYFRCNRTIPDDPKQPITGVIVHEECDSNLWWNPDLKPEGVAVGGSCDLWENLSDAVKDGYNSDPECVHEICLWGQEEACSRDYWYYDPKTHDSFEDRDHLKCSEGLIWDAATETCRSCEHVADCPC